MAACKRKQHKKLPHDWSWGYRAYSQKLLQVGTTGGRGSVSVRYAILLHQYCAQRCLSHLQGVMVTHFLVHIRKNFYATCAETWGVSGDPWGDQRCGGQEQKALATVRKNLEMLNSVFYHVILLNWLFSESKMPLSTFKVVCVTCRHPVPNWSAVRSACSWKGEKLSRQVQ